VFKEILKYAIKPDLYAPSTGNFWNDEHISKGMLEAHLNPSWDAASRNHDFIDKSVDWIFKIAPPSQYNCLLDLGCGPGLYAERFNNSGYSVVGVDFSERSVAYAKEQTMLNKSNIIKYLYQNYLEIDYTEQFDIVTLIYCDYAALPIDERRVLARKIRQALKPGGKFIFDVFTPVRRAAERRSWQYLENGGFFSAESHIHLEAVYQYNDSDKTELRQNIIITREQVYCYNIWDHYFDKTTLIAELQNFGFAIFEIFGDVAGKVFSDTGESMCVVITK
jgi:SAM-dependent methyltransferase